MRSVLYALVLLGVATASFATPFPTNYFYTCGEVDCSTFAHHDFSLLPDVLPLGGNPTMDSYWQNNRTVAGNKKGEAIGCGFYTTGCGSVYGFGGIAYVVSAGPDLSPLYGDINESGFWAIGADASYPFVWGNGSVVGGAVSFFVTLQGFQISIDRVLAINEAGDVYIQRGPYGSSGVGVLTNTAIPEPSTFALVAIGGLLILRGRRRQ